MALDKSVRHHRANSRERWLLEALGIWVSLLNGCGSCIEHHFAGLKRLFATYVPETFTWLPRMFGFAR